MAYEGPLLVYAISRPRLIFSEEEALPLLLLLLSSVKVAQFALSLLLEIKDKYPNNARNPGQKIKI